MGKKLLITEKPSVAMEFAKALKINTNRKNGYLESEDWIITWCVGHLVTMSYPEKYDDLLDEIHQKKQSTVLEKLERISMLMSMLEMLQ